MKSLPSKDQGNFCKISVSEKKLFNCGKEEIVMKSLPSKDQGNFYFCLHLSVCLPCYFCSVALAVSFDFFSLFSI